MVRNKAGVLQTTCCRKDLFHRKDLFQFLSDNIYVSMAGTVSIALLW